MARSRATGPLLSVVCLAALYSRVSIDELWESMRTADHGAFVPAVVASVAFTLLWDTFVVLVAVRWTYARTSFADLWTIRTASYVVGVFNTNVSRAAMILGISRRLGAPVVVTGFIILVALLSEYLHLALWATIGVTLAGVAPPAILLWPIALPIAVAAQRAIERRRPTAARRGALRNAVTAWWWRAVGQGATAAEQPDVTFLSLRRYLTLVALRVPAFCVVIALHYVAARAFGLHIPFVALLAGLPIVLFVTLLPVVISRLASSQAAWVLLFHHYDSETRLVAFALGLNVLYASTRIALALIFLPPAYSALMGDPAAAPRTGSATAAS